MVEGGAHVADLDEVWKESKGAGEVEGGGKLSRGAYMRGRSILFFCASG